MEAIEANKDNPGPQAPDVVDVGLAFGPQAKEAGQIQPYKVSTWDDIPEGAKDPEGFWYGDYYGVLSLEVNTAEVAAPPAEYADLLDPAYNGQVALSGDPLTSNAAMLSVWAAGLATGATGEEAAQAGLDFFAHLNEAGNFVPIDGDSRTVGIGETPILIDWSYNSIANDVDLGREPGHRDRRARRRPYGGCLCAGDQRLCATSQRGQAVDGVPVLGRRPARLGGGLLPPDPVRGDVAPRAPSPPRSLSSCPAPKAPSSRRSRRSAAAQAVIVEGWPSVVGVTVEPSPSGG